MGNVETIAHDRWPRQSRHLGRRCDVTFHYDTTRRVSGLIVRDDDEDPWETAIRLDDGRIVLGAECQYSPVGPSADDRIRATHTLDQIDAAIESTKDGDTR